MDGNRAALRIDFSHPQGQAVGLTLIPLDSDQPFSENRLSGGQAQTALAQMRQGKDFLIWIETGDELRFTFRGRASISWSRCLANSSRTIPVNRFNKN